MKKNTLLIVKILLTCIIMALCVVIFNNLYRNMKINKNKSIENFYGLEEDKKKILDGLKIKNNNTDDLKNLLQDTKKEYDSLKDKFNTNNQNFLKDIQGTLTKVDSINLTLDNEIDYIKTKLNGLEVMPVQKIKKETEPTKYPVTVLSSVLPIKTYMPPTPSPTLSSLLPSSLNTPSPTSSSSPVPTSLDTPVPISSSTPVPTSSSVTPNSTTSLARFQDILNMNPPKIPVEKFVDDWRTVWDAKIPQIPDNIRFLNDTNPYITEESTKFYFVKNPNLEDNLNKTTSDIISLNMKKMTDTLRNKWINNYNKLYKN